VVLPHFTCCSVARLPQAQKEKKEQLGFMIEDVKAEYATLADVIAKTNGKIMGITEEVGRHMRCVKEG